METITTFLSALFLYISGGDANTSPEYEKFKAEKHVDVYNDPALPYAIEADNRAPTGNYVWYRIATVDSVIPGVNY